MPKLLISSFLNPRRVASLHRATLRTIVAGSVACSGCSWISQWREPNRFANTAAATPLPQAYSQPPVEPPPVTPLPATVATPATTPVELPPPTPVAIEAPVDDRIEQTLANVEQLRNELAQLRSRQEQTQTALESLTASSLATASRSAAIEAHLALQSSLIDDLRTAAQQQQREQWKALDAVSEALDRLLKSPAAEQGAPPHIPPAQVPPSITPISPDAPDLLTNEQTASTHGTDP